MKIKILLGCSIIGLLSGCADKGQPDVPEIVKVQRVIPYHIVKNGDTIGTIATKYKMTRSELIEINNLTPPYQLYNGQHLVIKVQTQNTRENQDGMLETRNIDDDIIIKPNNSSDENSVPDTVSETKEPELGQTESPLKEEETRIEEEVKIYDKIWPILGARKSITQHFGDSKFDEGIILKASAGTPVKAMADGTVKLAKVPDGDAAAYGLTVIIKHDKHNMLSVYSHLSESSVKVGKKVKKGDNIGKVGKTGKVKNPQLYFEIFDISTGSRVSIDPEKILP